MGNAEISIIVPVYNVAGYLDKCISSIIGQTYDKLQIVLIDDGSTDGSSQICDEYQKRDLRITVIHKQNGGLVSARKAGLCAATGEYIGYVDGDDWIERDLYEHMLNVLIQYQVDMVETEHYMDAGEKSKRVKSNLSYGRYEANEIIPVMLCDKEFNECRLRPYLWSKLFRKSLLYESQMRVDEVICCGEDIAVTYPYMLKAESIYIADYAGYHYVQHQDSMTGIQSPVAWERDKRLILYLKTIFERSENNSKVMLRQLNQYAKSMLLLRHIDLFDRSSENKKLLPFGGIDLNCHIALYGAGRMGKSIYQYLERLSIDVVIWGDQEYLLYQRMGLPVLSPDEIVVRQVEFDILLIAVNSKNVSNGIKNSLIKKGLRADKAVWLTERFVSEEYCILWELA